MYCFEWPAVIGSTTWPLIRHRDRPFGVEICGEPGTTRGSLRHPLRPLFHWYYTRELRHMCQSAAATAYVTSEMFQQLYPPAAGAFTTHYSSIELPVSQVLSQPRVFRAANRPWRLICVGTFRIMYKGQDVLLEALARVIAVRLRRNRDISWRRSLPRRDGTFGPRFENTRPR